MDVLSARDRPITLLGGELAQLGGEVDRALVAQALEHLVRWAVFPQLPLGDQDVFDLLLVEVAASRCHVPLPPSGVGREPADDATGWLASRKGLLTNPRVPAFSL